MEKLASFERSGGLVLWVGCAPDGENGYAVTDVSDAVRTLAGRIGYGLGEERQEGLYVGLYEKEGRRMWYVVNSSPAEKRVTVDPGVPFTVWHTFNGEVSDGGSFVMEPYTSVFVTES